VIQRSFDATRVNELVNHPSIRPHIGGDPEAELDLSAAVADRGNIFLLGEHGGFAFIWTAPHTYEVHTFILPEGRGQPALTLALLARSAMADLWEAEHLWTRVHPDAANVRAFTLKAGFKPAGSQTLDLGAGPVTYDLFNWRP
jgi:RimJ/RimL family protein N-acetyltransferase